ncbi:MAG: hypothetical protein KDA60_21035, partial [Planctomycetales bacterium]|nr:hypothetical protein [Planctomycetales bacterium]
MVNELAIIWTVTGFAAGVLHARSIWNASRLDATWAALQGIVRIAGVTGVLCAAAVHGGLVWAALGWTFAFVMTVNWKLMRTS